MRIALVGNPNSGKTTMYNALTGRNEKTGNWAGVTVDRIENKLRSMFQLLDEEMVLVDLPGAYSMSPYTNEESITSKFVRFQNPDVIINIVDATNLSRNLFFTTQLLELGIPVVVALNKFDLNNAKGIEINVDLLSEKLAVPVVKTVAIDRENNGFVELLNKVIEVRGSEQVVNFVQDDIDLNDKCAVEEADKKRFDFVKRLVGEVEIRNSSVSEYSLGDKIDRLVTNKFIGIPLFALVMWLVFDISQARLGKYLAEGLAYYIEQFQKFVGQLAEGASPFIQALLIDGIIGGVGAVVGFLPLVMVMYFLISLLEDCGYMARVSVIMDPIFKRVGLSGKSIIPMIIGTGCSIPAVMACRTIKNERERRTTAMLTPFMPCGAKLPVIALFAGVFFANSSWIGTLMYFVGILFVFLGAFLILKINGQKYRKSFFIIELPEYKIPSLRLAIVSMFSRAKAYIVKAGTIILVCNALVQIMQTFNWNFQVVEEGMEHTSILASVASPFAILLIPLGFGVWQLAAAAVTGFIAKENVVGTLAVVYGLTSFIDVDALELVEGANVNQVATVMGLTSVAALAYLMFNLFTPPCFAAIGAMNSEIQDRKWLFAGIALQFATGYFVAFWVYQIGTLFTVGYLGNGFIPGLIVCLVIIAVISYLIFRANKNIESEYSLH